MTSPTFTTALATEEDGPILASLVTAAFAASDPAFRLIWGSSPSPKWSMHDKFALDGIFTPVQKDGRLTYKAIDSSTEKIVGFTTWSLPTAKIDSRTKKESDKGGPPVLPGIDLSLFLAKFGKMSKSYEKYADGEKDMLLSMMFVHPDYQRRGIASSLIKWGTGKADEIGAKLWLGSTPSGLPLYEKHGWKVVEQHTFDLAEFGGEGIYKRAWMLREVEV